MGKLRGSAEHMNCFVARGKCYVWMCLKILFYIVRRRVGLHCGTVPELLGGRPWGVTRITLTDGSDRQTGQIAVAVLQEHRTQALPSCFVSFFFPGINAAWRSVLLYVSSDRLPHSAPCLPACVNYIFPSLTKAYQLRPSTNENESRLESQCVWGYNWKFWFMVDERNVFHIFYATRKTILYNGACGAGSLLWHWGEEEGEVGWTIVLLSSRLATFVAVFLLIFLRWMSRNQHLVNETLSVVDVLVSLPWILWVVLPFVLCHTNLHL